MQLANFVEKTFAQGEVYSRKTIANSPQTVELVKLQLVAFLLVIDPGHV
jgi:hypothetical protein